MAYGSEIVQKSDTNLQDNLTYEIYVISAQIYKFSSLIY